MFLYKVSLPCSLYKNFTYGYDKLLQEGQFVVCNLRNKITIGVIVGTEKTYSGPVKNIEKVLQWKLAPSQMDFLRWLSNYTLTPLGMCCKLTLPFPIKEIEKLEKKFECLDWRINENKNLAKLNTEQNQSLIEIKKDSEKFSPFLLDGITGSGKTEVYFHAIHEALEKNKQTLVLLPEVSLTKQFVNRFESCFGIKPLVWHNKTTAKNKRLIFNTLYQNTPCVVVGARSSLFLPYKNLGLIVVDEEHDSSYKQEEQIIYNARDAAVMKAKFQKCPIILASATPSLETYHNAEKKLYKTLLLKSRYTQTELPGINLVDMRKKGNKNKKIHFISHELLEGIKENILKKEQTLLFINRRGYSPLLLCDACGFRYDCANCSATLVYHEKENKLKCHHCNHIEAYPQFCKNCGTKDQFFPCGPGIEKLSKEVKQLFPNTSVLEISSDTLSSPKTMDEAFEKITTNQANIIIGTQLMAKGHHFPNLTLVGVIDADMGLSGIDLRACEKTFQLLFQVIGRAGREAKKGKIYIQTHNPENAIIESLKNYDKDSFLQEEYNQRKIFQMPPFSKLASITLSSRKKEDLLKAVSKVSKKIPHSKNFQIIGPSTPPLSKVRGKERRRFLLIAEKEANRQKFISEWLFKEKFPHSVQLSIDIDPISFM